MRQKILEAFNSNGEYSHVLPFAKTNYIDGMFHVSMLAKAAWLSGDTEMYHMAQNWLANLTLNPGYRDWTIVDGSVVPLQKKEQSFAGPCALQYSGLMDWPGVETKAKLFCMISPIVLYGYKTVSFLKQHVNSVMLAHLLLGKKPGGYEELYVDNPFYNYIRGVKCPVPDYAVRKPWGSAWLWKQFPVERTIPEDMAFEYTPTALYVAQALQETL